jgi:hypothetical protein
LHYGFFSGRELSGYGISGLESGKFYDATVTVVGGYTVQAFVAPDPTVNMRPVFTASFYRTRDRIANYGIGQRLRDVERLYLIALRFLVRNMANSSEPVTELNVRKLAKSASEEDFAKIAPGMVIPIEDDMPNDQRPAVRFSTIANNMASYEGILQYFMDLAHLVTNIPAGLHGTAVGTGANRTFRGMANLQSNAIKSLEAAVGNIDETVFLPMGHLLYGYNMLYEDDETIKGDSKVLAQGVQGLLAREINRNNAMELLQLIGSVGAQLGPSVTPLVDWALQQMLTAMRVPPDIASQVKFGQPQPQPQPQPASPEGALPPPEGAPSAGGEAPAGEPTGAPAAAVA